MLMSPNACSPTARAGMSLLPYVFSGLLLASVSASANMIPVGSVSLNADFPLVGEQAIVVTNLTGLVDGCNSFYPACSDLAVTAWKLTVDYTSTFYNQSANPSLASPYVLQWQSGVDDIEPGASLTVAMDLCNGVDVSDCATSTTTLTSISFSGEISPASFAIYDPTANGGSGGPGAAFFSAGTFSTTFTPTSGFPNDFFEAKDITVGATAAPEPSSIWLLGLLSAFFICKSRRGARRSAVNLPKAGIKAFSVISLD